MLNQSQNYRHFPILSQFLDDLVSYLPKYPNLKPHFSNANEKHYQVRTKKDFLPYDSFDSYEKIDKIILPSIDTFYYRLEDKK